MKWVNIKPTACAKMKIAIVGGGIAGLGAAWSLSKYHEVTLYERAPVLDGHARTVEIKKKARCMVRLI